MPRRDCQNHEPSLRRVTFRDESPKAHCRNFLHENRVAIRVQKPPAPIREVPAFSRQVRQKNTRALGLSRERSQSVDQSQKKTNDLKLFKSYYENGLLPIKISYRERNMDTVWTVDPAELPADDLVQLIKKIAVGLPLLDRPYRLLAYNSFNYLLNMPVDAEILLDAMADIIAALRKSLEAPDESKKIEAIQLILKLCKVPPCAYALVAFYRHLLPPLRMVKSAGFNGYLTPTSVKLDQQIDLLLRTLEETGGPNAYINIKYILPLYQSQLKM